MPMWDLMLEEFFFREVLEKGVIVIEYSRGIGGIIIGVTKSGTSSLSTS